MFRFFKRFKDVVTSRSRAAFKLGVVEGDESMEGWSGFTMPDDPIDSCPFNPKTQDALCRAYKGGFLFAQSIEIENRLREVM